MFLIGTARGVLPYFYLACQLQQGIVFIIAASLNATRQHLISQPIGSKPFKEPSDYSFRASFCLFLIQIQGFDWQTLEYVCTYIHMYSNFNKWFFPIYNVITATLSQLFSLSIPSLAKKLDNVYNFGTWTMIYDFLLNFNVIFILGNEQLLLGVKQKIKHKRVSMQWALISAIFTYLCTAKWYLSLILML
jgi:hypothetical protein